MSLSVCKECGQGVNTNDQRCGNCGTVIPPRDSPASLVVPAVLVVLLLVGGLWGWLSVYDNMPPPTVLTAQEIRQNGIEQQFSPFDGHHMKLTRMIKESMNDPDSFDHVETKYGDLGDHLIVDTVYRGKNSFGGIVFGAITARVALDGEVLEVVSQE